MAKPKILAELEKVLSDFTTRFQDSLTNTDKIIDQLLDVDTKASGIAKSFGVGRDNIQSINAGLTEAITKVSLLGGSFNDVARIQQEVSETLGRNVISTSDTVEKLYETFRVTDVPVSKLVGNFKDIGFSTGQISGQMEKVVDSARLIGVNATAVSKQAVDNMSSMNKFNFQNGVEGLAKMAAQAVNLRVDMRETLNLAEKMFDPEQAINMAAAMQRLGVAQGDLLDPLRLMDLAQNDPTELQNQIAEMSKQFVQLNEKGQFEIMPGARRQMMEIAKEMNIPYETLTKMAIAGSELDTKMQKIKFPGDAFTEEQEKFIANMAEMDSQGNYTLKVDGKDMGIDKAMELFSKDKESFNKFMKDSEPKSMEDLAKDQLSTLETIAGELRAINTTGYGLAGSKTGKDMLQVTREGVKTAGAFTRAASPIGATTKQQSETIDLVYNGLSGLADVLTGEESLQNVLTKLGGLGTTVVEQIDTNLKTAASGASESLNKLAQSGNQFYELIMKFTSDTKIKKGTPEQTGENKIEVKDFMIKTLPEDKIVMAGGTNLDNSKNTTTTNNSMPEEIKITITHDIKGTPPNIDVAQLAQMMTNSDITQTIVREIKRTSTNNGLNEPYRPTEAFGYVG